MVVLRKPADSLNSQTPQALIVSTVVNPDLWNLKGQNTLWFEAYTEAYTKSFIGLFFDFSFGIMVCYRCANIKISIQS